MKNTEKSAQKLQRVQRPCTTPQRMRMVESIKKSIHRSINKIDPSQYKNILKGQCIFMHLCYKGQIINSEYNKVALFMGAVIMKRAVQKVTVIVTNQSTNKNVKKLVSMGKPILSVLWLQACFQEKRKVPYEDFPFQSDKKQENQVQKQQQNVSNFDNLANIYETYLQSISQGYFKNNKMNFLRFIDKREKVDRNKGNIIPIHDIDIGIYQQQHQHKRKSQIITQNKAKKKIEKKKNNQVKSQGLEKQKQSKTLANVKSVTFDRVIDANENDDQLQHINQQQNTNNKPQDSKQSLRLNKTVYEKYLKDFNNYQQKINTINSHISLEQPILKLQQIDTPFFNLSQSQYYKEQEEKQNLQHAFQKKMQTPRKKQHQEYQQLKTCSMKKSIEKNVKICVINPLISEKVERINKIREQFSLPLLQIAGVESRNVVYLITRQSKIQAVLALLSHPKKILSQSFIKALQKCPTSVLNQQFLQKFQIKCHLNTQQIKGKKIVLLDSVMGVSSLSKIINQCKGIVISMSEYLFKTDIDIVVTNKKKNYFKGNYQVLTQGDFIDMIITF